jgi:hypothetical protein
VSALLKCLQVYKPTSLCVSKYVAVVIVVYKYVDRRFLAGVSPVTSKVDWTESAGCKDA